jgi:hypothetical protein
MPNASSDITLLGLSLNPAPQDLDENVRDRIGVLWEFGKRFIILSGPPGVGKSKAAIDFVSAQLASEQAPFTVETCRLSSLFPDFLSKVYSDAEIRTRLAVASVDFVWDLTVLHPQYSYEDLIRGYRIGMLGFMSRVAVQITSQAQSSPRAVLIMDEINRAPIGQLFGEAIFSLDRRGSTVTTPYELKGHGSGFMIPPSLLLLGTMNSVDRATAGFDFALRRRIATVQIPPMSAPIEKRFASAPPGVREAGRNLFGIVERVVLAADQAGILPRSELVLGHALFLPPANIADSQLIGWLTNSFVFQILPTLVDYQEQGLLTYKENTGISFLDTALSGTKKPESVDLAAVSDWILGLDLGATTHSGPQAPLQYPATS